MAYGKAHYVVLLAMFFRECLMKSLLSFFMYTTVSKHHSKGAESLQLINTHLTILQFLRNISKVSPFLNTLKKKKKKKKAVR